MDKLNNLITLIGSWSLKIGQTSFLFEEIISKKDINRMATAIIREMEGVDENTLAVIRGICPFPFECNEIKVCNKDHCNADVCSNGYSYRFS